MFITLEGTEGSGKSTLLRGLTARLEADGQRVWTTREPGGSDLGRHLRGLLLNPAQPVDPVAELLLFLADRAQHVAEGIRPALASGAVVLCDRSVDSTLAYQGYGRGFDRAELRRLCRLATGTLWPDVTLLLDLDPVVGLERAAARQRADGSFAAEGRFEAESLTFHRAVRAGFLDLAVQEPERITVLDATLSPSALLDTAWRVVRCALAGREQAGMSRRA